jgi:hypothetical protein
MPMRDLWATMVRVPFILCSSRSRTHFPGTMQLIVGTMAQQIEFLSIHAMAVHELRVPSSTPKTGAPVDETCRQIGTMFFLTRTPRTLFSVLC